MDDIQDFLDFMDNNIELRGNNMRVLKRYLRNQVDPFEFFNADSFERRFRFSEEDVLHYLLPIIEDDLIKINRRGVPVPPVMQLLMALRFYASGSYQAVIGDLVQFSQATVHHCIKRVSIALAKNFRRYVHFPITREEQILNIEMFYQISHFPHVAACVDGTLVKIASPGKNIGEIFRCRKGFFSLNVMCPVGPRGEFLFMDVRHPGSVHDQTCFDRSALKSYFSENLIKGLILGDNGYGYKPYLLTPILQPRNISERLYNQCHKKTRNLIERTFGRWKAKFSCLKRGLKNNVDNNIAIICSSAVLWNLHIHMKYPNLHIEPHEINRDCAQYLDIDPENNINGIDSRRNFIMRNFM